MKMRFSFMLLFLLAVFLRAESLEMLSMEGANAIIEHVDECVQTIESQRIYLRPEAIHLYENNFTLEFSDTTGMVLPTLYADLSGYFVLCNHSFGWECTACHRVYSTKPSRCRCGNATFRQYIK